MSGYIGSQPADSFLSISSQQITGNGGATYSLNSNVTNPEDIAIFVNNVRQNVNTYSVSNNQVTLGGTISSSDSCYVIFLGKTLATINPPSGSVGLNELSATGTKNNTTFLRGDNTFATPSGGTNTPAFMAYLSANQSISNSTYTKVQCNLEVFDTDNAYDNSSNYRFTPQTAGKYYFFAQTRFTTNSDFEGTVIQLRKNGSAIFDMTYNNVYYNGMALYGIVDMNGSSDYLELFVEQASGGTLTISGSDATRHLTKFGAYKIIT
jgi:hypothetical protein